MELKPEGLEQNSALARASPVPWKWADLKVGWESHRQRWGGASRAVTLLSREMELELEPAGG